MEGLSLTLQGRRWRVAAKEELEGQRLHRLRRKMWWSSYISYGASHSVSVFNSNGFLSPAFIILLSLCFHLLQTEALPWLKACRMMHLLKPLQKPIFISQKCPTLPEESANTHHKISQKLSIYPVREWRRWNYIAISVHFDSPQWIVLTTLDSQQKSNWCRVVDSFLLQLRN